MKYLKELCGSKLEILIHQEGDFSCLIQESFEIGKNFEDRYSRFIAGNYLDRLNIEKKSNIDRELYTLVSLCLKISDMSDGYFDITVRDTLEKKGYGYTNKNLSENKGYKNIILSKNNIELKNNVSIDLGSIGKGFIVDKIYNLLDSRIEKFTINFGGDIRVKGQETIKLEDPYQENKYFGEIVLNTQAIASSSGNKRVFNNAHHLINMKNGESQDDKKILYVTHSLGVFADVISTALYVSPLNKSLEILSSIPGLEGMIIDSKGKIYKSQGFVFIANKEELGK